MNQVIKAAQVIQLCLRGKQLKWKQSRQRQLMQNSVDLMTSMLSGNYDRAIVTLEDLIKCYNFFPINLSDRDKDLINLLVGIIVEQMEPLALGRMPSIIKEAALALLSHMTCFGLVCIEVINNPLSIKLLNCLMDSRDHIASCNIMIHMLIFSNVASKVELSRLQEWFQDEQVNKHALQERSDVWQDLIAQTGACYVKTDTCKCLNSIQEIQYKGIENYEEGAIDMPLITIYTGNCKLCGLHLQALYQLKESTCTTGVNIVQTEVVLGSIIRDIRDLLESKETRSITIYRDEHVYIYFIFTQIVKITITWNGVHHFIQVSQDVEQDSEMTEYTLLEIRNLLG